MLLTFIISLFVGLSVGGFAHLILRAKIALHYNILFAIIGALIGGLTVYALSVQIYAWAIEIAVAAIGAFSFALTANLLPKQ